MKNDQGFMGAIARYISFIWEMWRSKTIVECEELGFKVVKNRGDYLLVWPDKEQAAQYEFEASNGVHGQIFYICTKEKWPLQCWVYDDGRIKIQTFEDMIHARGINHLSHKPWGEKIAERVWNKYIREKNSKYKFQYFIGHIHRDFCGQGLFALNEDEAKEFGQMGEGIGIFLSQESCPQKWNDGCLFFWTDKISFVNAFSKLSDYGLSGVDDSVLYARLPKDYFHLGNQQLTLARIKEWLRR